MNIAEFSIKKNVITLVFAFLLLFVGIQSLNQLSRLEDPEFTIKTAQIITPYPGATAAEVEEEVSNLMEEAAQELGEVLWIESQSQRGLSIVKVEIQEKYNKNHLPQIWDELRRKVGDYQGRLPPGAGPSWVNDDFGDVYGVFFALTGEDYTMAELYDAVYVLQKELVLVDDVSKVTLFGDLPEAIYVEMSLQKMSQLGISQNDIYKTLSDKNIAIPAGYADVGSAYVRLNPTGDFRSEKEFGDLLVSKPGSETLIYLKDVANIKRGYRDPPDRILRIDGQRAIGIAISTAEGGNVVSMGEALEKRIKELMPQLPLGMEYHPIYIQSNNVIKAIDAFMVNLIEAVIIVIVVLMIFMGLKSAFIIGAILLLTISGTFIFMNAYNIMLERISLGALIISLGMLVDNAIVVVEGMKVKIEQGQDALSAAKEVVGQTGTPLLGATAVAIAAFAVIGASQDSTGEFCRSLFQVIMIALSLSWVTAVTITPLFCKMFIKPKKTSDGASKDPYGSKMFTVYRKNLIKCLNKRWKTVGVVVILFLLAIFAFGFINQQFFPNSTTAQFLVDVWFPEGKRIDYTVEELEEAEEYLLGLDDVTGVTLAVGSGFPRFLLTYGPENPSYTYGQFIVSVDDYRKIDGLMPIISSELNNFYPDATFGTKKYVLGPGEGGKIQLRIMGPDPEELRRLAGVAKTIIEDDPDSQTVRDEWREKVNVIRPQMALSQARRAGIGRAELSVALESASSGTTTGVYREKHKLIPILARAPESDRATISDINNLVVWSPAAQRMIPMNQVVNRFKMEFENANVWRRDRTRMIRVHADPIKGYPSELFARVKPKIEKALNVDVEAVLGEKRGKDPFANFNDKILPVEFMKKMPLKDKPGYYISWGGEAENSAKAQAGLGKTIPIFLGLMVLIVICLFNAFRQPLIIWLCVPMAIIGVSFGLLITGGAFGFMALLGLLSLSGMLIKNAIVLIDEIDLEIESGKDRYQSIVDSGVSRLRPVLMAAATTILGMTPLLKDAFFRDMAITIMAGLGFASILTLIVVPVLYSIFFRIKPPGEK